jgi:hypothetical protein
MKVILAEKCEKSDKTNPYTTQLYEALAAHLKPISLDIGLDQFWKPRHGIDILHIQWPESLVPRCEPDDDTLRRVKSTLRGWKEFGTRVVVTIHNAHPHGADNVGYYELYREVFSAADGFVHLGQASISVVKQRFPALDSHKIHRVITHGDYSCLRGDFTDRLARKALEIPDGVKVVTCLGHIRDTRELKLLSRAFDSAGIKNSRLIVAGRLPNSSRKSLQFYRLRAPFFLSKKKLLFEGRIPSGEIQKFILAADVVAISRIGSLNSGNIALGFTFGKVVVGPDTGVIGEQLHVTNNPVYNPENDASFGAALRQGFELAEAGHGELNRQWAAKHMNWNQVGEQHLRIYQEVLRSHRL